MMRVGPSLPMPVRFGQDESGPKLNNKYTITVGHPLVRPGLEITTEASEGYVVPVVEKLMGMVRSLNGSDAAPDDSSQT